MYKGEKYKTNSNRADNPKPNLKLDWFANL